MTNPEFPPPPLHPEPRLRRTSRGSPRESDRDSRPEKSGCRNRSVRTASCNPRKGMAKGKECVPRHHPTRPEPRVDPYGMNSSSSSNGSGTLKSARRTSSAIWSIQFFRSPETVSLAKPGRDSTNSPTGGSGSMPAADSPVPRPAPI